MLVKSDLFCCRTTQFTIGPWNIWQFPLLSEIIHCSSKKKHACSVHFIRNLFFFVTSWTVGHQPSVYGNSPGKNMGRAAILSSRGISWTGDRTWARDRTSEHLCIAGRYFTTEPLGKPLEGNSLLFFAIAPLLHTTSHLHCDSATRLYSYGRFNL